ncbi:hypothetical protein VNO78_09986 [Psophocarpus tetragonolobus]|uniref:Glutaredoxin domain-containing protein n=1 Tax=Psophocarpus tetragonolobus TaxID=3891 RepID=A0AAN9XLU0_PSOTE
MGCVSSNLVKQEEELRQQIHMVSLISSSYGLLKLDREEEEEEEEKGRWEAMFEKICPPKGEKRVVIYTTTLRGVRRTFEACNAVRAALEGLGVMICERDVSMDRGFREELRGLLKGKGKEAIIPPRVFVKGFYIGGADELLKLMLAHEPLLRDLLQGLPTKPVGSVCHACGGFRFFPCFTCYGSCKTLVSHHHHHHHQGTTLFVKCTRCNENGLVLCPLCT